MSYDGKLLARARDELDRIREKNAAERTRRMTEAYALRPELRLCDDRMREQMTELVRLTLSGGEDAAAKIEALREENLALQRRRGELLAQLGHTSDWLDEIVSCEKCRDSGIYRGGVCDCLQRLYNAELTRDVGVLLKNGDESFEKFNLTLYDDRPLPGGSVSPRETMKKVLSSAKDFADSFSVGAGSLLFQGGTGLGKTFLSACIAREVAEKGFSVCYDTAASVVGSFEAQKFSRDESADARVKRMLSCDLMILDDLGTEMPTPMAESALYTLINTRLVEGRSTIISTNLSFGEMEKRYSGQVCSRIRGEYRLLPFIGRDIRQIKR
ncbi:MAG: ATP-binding protein [Oscillospiraceae bacterium]|nr:ATP-binding protein [Oscillospiraceae bacterium]